MSRCEAPFEPPCQNGATVAELAIEHGSDEWLEAP